MLKTSRLQRKNTRFFRHRSEMETDDNLNFHPKSLELLFSAADTYVKKMFVEAWKRKANPKSMVIIGDVFNLLFSDL